MRKITQRNTKISRINIIAPVIAVARKILPFVGKLSKPPNNDFPFVLIMCSMLFHASDTLAYSPTISSKLPSISRNTNRKKLCFNIF